MPFPPRLLKYKGREQSIAAWARDTGIPEATIRSRIDTFGWSVADALSTPIDRRRSHYRAGRPGKNTPRPCPPMARSKSGIAYARWKVKGQRFYRYFGEWGTEEAASAYMRFQIEWAEGLWRLKSARGGTLVSELAESYLDYAANYYRKHGRQTSEYHLAVAAIGHLTEVAGDKLIADFTADDLRLCQSLMVQRGLARRTVNGYVGRIRRCFDWGASRTNGVGRPLVAADIVLALQRVENLAKGRTDAPDYPTVQAVEWERVEKTFPHLNDHPGRRAVLEALIRVHWLTGMRSTEILRMRPTDIDRSRAEWRYSLPPEINKVEHREGNSHYWIGPKAQAILTPLLAHCPPDRPVFAMPPRDKKGKGPWRTLSREGYYRMVQLACKAAGVDAWNPHQLRHSRATEVERIYESSDAAAAAIGDSPEVTRRVYVDPNETYRRRIARETG